MRIKRPGFLKKRERWLPASGPLAGHGGADYLYFLFPAIARRGGAPSGAAGGIAMIIAGKQVYHNFFGVELDDKIPSMHVGAMEMSERSG